MKINENIRKLVNTAILTAVVLVLGFISNYISFGPININLALLAIIIGACFVGPLAGFWLGVVDGFVICLAPSTLAFFMSYNWWATILLCILKTGLAGYVAGLLYKYLGKINSWLGSVSASLMVPIINTAVYIGAVFVFFLPQFAAGAADKGVDVVKYFITITLTQNWIIEMLVVGITTPLIHRLVLFLSLKYEQQMNNHSIEKNEEIEE